MTNQNTALDSLESDSAGLSRQGSFRQTEGFYVEQVKSKGVQVYTLIRLSGEDLSLCRLHAHAPEVIHHHAQKAEVSSSDTTQVREGTL